jgi:hypothetical protein
MSKARSLADFIEADGSATIDGLTVGQGAGNVATNTAVGASALAANTSGIQNTGLGANALQYQTNNNNTALGYNAMVGVNGSSSGGSNTAVGSNSLAGLTVGNFNTAIGQQALQANTTASNNTAVGYQALYSTTTGYNCTALGANALRNNTATGNTAVGQNSLNSTTTGQQNNALGDQSMRFNTTGSYNIAIGNAALYSNTTASNNTAVGYRSLYTNTTGTKNTIMGNDAGYGITTGGYNTCIGSDSGKQITTGSKNTILGGYNGNQGGLDIRTSSNNIVLSDGDGNPRGFFNGFNTFWVFGDGNAASYYPWVSSAAVSGIVINGIGGQASLNNLTASSNIFVNKHATAGRMISFSYSGSEVGYIYSTSSATSYNTSSDYRLKENVVPMSGATERLKQLKPSRFNFIADPDKTVDGFLAHEVSDIVPEAITGEKDAVDADGNPVYQGIDQSKLVPLLVATIQELEARIAALESN